LEETGAERPMTAAADRPTPITNLKVVGAEGLEPPTYSV
jgi:hypothetical protein